MKTIVESLIFLRFVGFQKKTDGSLDENQTSFRGQKGNLANDPEIGASMSF